MILPIDDEYRIASDRHQWMIQRARQRTPNGQSVLEWGFESSYPTFEGAVRELGERLVRESEGLSEEQLGAFLRKHGLHSYQLDEWRKLAVTALGEEGKRVRRKKTAEQLEIERLRKELDRKDKALAELAALLVLKKKVREIWGDGDDDTISKSGR